MLHEMINDNYGVVQDYNCAERILNGANESYELGLEGQALKLAAVFGGGMGAGKTCGAVIAALMVYGMTHTETVAHKNPEVKEKAAAFLEAFEKRMGSVECRDLKEKYWTEADGCKKVIYEAAVLLDEFMKEDA